MACLHQPSIMHFVCQRLCVAGAALAVSTFGTGTPATHHEPDVGRVVHDDSGLPPANPVFSAVDTIAVRVSPTPPALDGRSSEREYGPPSVHIPTAAGEVRVWLTRHGGFVYIGADLPDSSFYWGDDFLVSLDANGSADATPQPGDRQWYLRRTLDSSVVFAAVSGGWNTPGQMPPMLGASRRDTDWDVASASTSAGWSIELRIREQVFDGARAVPRVAFRTYNDNPQGWWSLPLPPTGTLPQRVERNPQLWAPMRLVP